MAARALLVFFAVSVLLLAATFSSIRADDDLDEDLSFLESSDDAVSSPTDNLGQFDSDYEWPEEADEDQHDQPEVDEKDVVVLKDGNFSDFIAKNRFVMVEFYAPWCGHCQALAPEYAAAATELKGEVVLAKVDGSEESELAQKYDIQGFPTLYFFVDGVHKSYDGQRHKDAIVTWVKKKTGSSIYNLTTTEEAERILATESKVVLGFLDSLVGSESEELAAASRLEDEVTFYQTTNPDIVKLFHIEPQVKRPALVLLKKEAEKLLQFDGQFSKLEIAEFISANKLPLVITFTRESAPIVFESSIKKQLLLFVTSNDTEKILPAFQEAAKTFKGKLLFVYVQMDNDDYGRSVSDYFGVTGDAPRVLGYTGNDDARKFILDSEMSLSNIKSFAEDFLEDKLKPFYKSDPIPEKNDGDVKIVVGNNFDEIVLDESKDVLLEIYAPWCGHCQSLEPIYNKLAKYLKGIDSIVIAKMDGTTNEHPRAKPDGFPTLLFFPAGNKSFEPITVDNDRTVVAFYKFLKKHASIPFKLQKPDTAKISKGSGTTENQESMTNIVKDEL